MFRDRGRALVPLRELPHTYLGGGNVQAKGPLPSFIRSSRSRQRFQISRVRLAQVYFPRLAREQNFLIVHQALQILDFAPALRELFVGRHKQTHDHEHDRDKQQDAENTVQTLPNGGLTPRAKIAIAWMIH